MMSVSTSEESERRLAEAMRAQASGAGRPGFVGRNPGSLGPSAPGNAASSAGPAPARTPGTAAAGTSAPWTSAPRTSSPWTSEPRAAAPRAAAPGVGTAQPPGLWAALVSSRFPLLLALLGGVVLGVALALLSLFAPGVLPPLG
jgi:hypothetical protein